MLFSQNTIPLQSKWRPAQLLVLIVFPIGLANAEEGKDWSIERREFVERIEEFTREIKEHHNEGSDSWAKHLSDRRDFCKSMLARLDQILDLEQELTRARTGQAPDRIEQFNDKLEALADEFGRAERIGEMEGRLSELKVEKDELAQAGEVQARQRVEAFVVDQEKLLELVREFHEAVATDDDTRVAQLDTQVNQREESLLLRIDEFHLERHMIEARQEGEDVRELEAELRKTRKALRELASGSK